MQGNINSQIDVSLSSQMVRHEVVEDGVQHVELLSASNDEHGGVIVDMKNPMDPKAFATVLKASLSQWKRQGKKGVWIKVPIELVNLVEIAVKEGFWYHHAEPNYLMLVFWIPETPNTIPANASHKVIIGAFIMNDKREILVVQEKNGRLRGLVWKIPTGTVDAGEDIFKAAVREVKEETGIESEFVEVLAFRQSHQLLFGKSGLSFLCLLRPLSFDIQMQELEIEAAQWMPFEDYAAQPFVQKHEFYKYITDICLEKMDRNYAGFSPVPVSSFFMEDQLSYFYLNNRDLNRKNRDASWAIFSGVFSGHALRRLLLQLQAPFSELRRKSTVMGTKKQVIKKLIMERPKTPSGYSGHLKQD